MRRFLALRISDLFRSVGFLIGSVSDPLRCRSSAARPVGERRPDAFVRLSAVVLFIIRLRIRCVFGRPDAA
jgi:hypothetical protein